MTVLHRRMCIKVGPSSLRHVPAEYKDKVLDVSDSHRNILKLCNSKLKLPKFKDLCKNYSEVKQPPYVFNKKRCS